jgi:dienelactone hydrolase
MGHARRALSLILICGLAACASPTTTPGLQITTTVPGGGTEQIPAMLSKPDGAGPFPAVVIMHDCSGLGPGSGGAPGRWAAELVERGYVVILPDSFKTRGFLNGVCTDAAPGRAEVGPLRRAYDARAAAAYLRTLPYVDARRIGLMGGSHGGSTTLNTMLFSGFAAAVALYPRCAPRGVYRPTAPVLILIGEKDDWTPAEPCRKLADAAQAAEQPVSIKVYPGAHHSFDSPFRERYVAARINTNAPGGRGATTGGDPSAWADSKKEVAGFFAAHLR